MIEALHFLENNMAHLKNSQNLNMIISLCYFAMSKREKPTFLCRPFEGLPAAAAAAAILGALEVAQ